MLRKLKSIVREKSGCTDDEERYVATSVGPNVTHVLTTVFFRAGLEEVISRLRMELNYIAVSLLR